MLNAPKLRWDRADLKSYYDFTGCSLEQLLDRINRFSQSLNVNDSANDCPLSTDYMMISLPF